LTAETRTPGRKRRELESEALSQCKAKIQGVFTQTMKTLSCDVARQR
jgi:hypothetical protein